MINSPKFFLGGCFIFITLVIIVSISRSCQDCGSHEAMEQFNDIGSAKEIRLFQTFPGWESNLVKDTIIITDESTIHSIQKMIRGRQRGSWDHPVAIWNVTLMAKMVDGSSVTVRISKIDGKERMTHVYPGNKDCPLGYPEYSLVLGDYLEQVTGYTGINNK